MSTLGGWAPLIGAGISGLGSLAGGLINSGAARDAADTQSDAARESNALLAAIYGQNRADQEPYRQAGYTALNQLQGMAGQQPRARTPSVRRRSWMPRATGSRRSWRGIGFKTRVACRAPQDYRYTPGAAPSAAAYHYTPGAAVSAGRIAMIRLRRLQRRRIATIPASFLRPQDFTFTPPVGRTAADGRPRLSVSAWIRAAKPSKPPLQRGAGCLVGRPGRA